MRLRLGFFASGKGSNVEAILGNIENGSLDAEAKIVISNNPDAGVLEIAQKRGIYDCCLNSQNYSSRFETLDRGLLFLLAHFQVNLVVLAGYNKQVGVRIIEDFPNRILNIHPALDLERFGGKGMYGLRVHESVLKSGEKRSGATVHLVTGEYDKGRILGQREILVEPDDTPKSLAAKVLEQEHILYSQVLREINLEKINLYNALPK